LYPSPIQNNNSSKFQFFPRNYNGKNKVDRNLGRQGKGGSLLQMISKPVRIGSKEGLG